MKKTRRCKKKEKATRPDTLLPHCYTYKTSSKNSSRTSKINPKIPRKSSSRAHYAVNKGWRVSLSLSSGPYILTLSSMQSYPRKKDPCENYKEFVTTNKPQANHPSSWRHSISSHRAWILCLPRKHEHSTITFWHSDTLIFRLPGNINIASESGIHTTKTHERKNIKLRFAVHTAVTAYSLVKVSRRFGRVYEYHLHPHLFMELSPS
jgi:hypothetical protein